MGKMIKKLNGNWNFKIDPAGIGEQNKWYKKPVAGSKVTVPAVWQTYDRDMVQYNGYAWYSNEFYLKERDLKERLFLRFEAVDYIADVWINGEYLGSHEGGYTPFQFEINNCVQEEKNLLVVRVYDPEDVTEIPHGKQGSWYTRASGIWQDVSIVKYGKSFIKRALITPDIDHQKAIVTLNIDSFDKLKAPGLEFEVFSPLNGEVMDKFEFSLKDNSTNFELKLSRLYLWDVKKPYIYNINIYLKDGEEVVDKYQTYFGMRKVEIKDGKLYLNNHPLYVRGALDQAFWPKTIYVAEDENLIKKEIKQAKDMGFNLLRKHIKTEDPRYLYWADHMGILIWEEPANYVRWTPQAKERFKKEYTEMVLRDYNHPSIIAWSIYNEEWGLEWKLKDNKEMQKWVAGFYNYAKDLDPTRPVCDNSGWAHVKTDINDYHRYYAVPENYREWKKDLDEGTVAKPENNYVTDCNDEVPVIVSEFGIWGLPELSSLEERYSKLPPWFFGKTGEFNEDFKIPQTARKNFSKYGLDKIFADFDELAILTQAREYRGVKYLIEEMRKREAINGYVVTELTDIEWETNGFLTYFREPKNHFNKARNFNGDISIMLDFNKHNYWSGNMFSAYPYIVNNTDKTFKGFIKWELEGTDLSGNFPVEVDSYSIDKINRSINFTLPEKGSKYMLKYYLYHNDEKIAENQEELTVTQDNIMCENNKLITTYRLDETFSQNLKENGFVLQEEIGEVCLTTCLDERIENYLRQGGKAIFLAERGSEILHKGKLNFKKLEDGESWDRASTFNFMNTGFFPDLPLQKISGWELQDLYASYVVKNLDDLNWEQLISGTFYGWIGSPGATMFEMDYGQGKLLVVTLKLVSAYNKQPVGTKMLHRLIDYYLG